MLYFSDSTGLKHPLCQIVVSIFCSSAFSRTMKPTVQSPVHFLLQTVRCVLCGSSWCVLGLVYLQTTFAHISCLVKLSKYLLSMAKSCMWYVFFFLFRICNNNKVQGVYYDEWAWMWLEYLYGFFLFYFFFCPFICYSMFCHTVKIPNVDSWLFQSLVRFYIWTYWKYVATRGHYITRILQNMQEGFIFWGVFS